MNTTEDEMDSYNLLKVQDIRPIGISGHDWANSIYYICDPIDPAVKDVALLVSIMGPIINNGQLSHQQSHTFVVRIVEGAEIIKTVDSINYGYTQSSNGTLIPTYKPFIQVIKRPLYDHIKNRILELIKEYEED